MIVFLFFGFLYPFHLHYQEQYQLFLFTEDYFLQYASQPGGFSNYLGTFITQFFFYPLIGSFFIAVLLVLLQKIVLWTSIRIGAKRSLFIISYYPSLLYWGLLCDESYLVSGLIAVLFIAFGMYLFTFFKSTISKFLFILLGIPFLFWISGGAIVFFFIFAVIHEISAKSLSGFKKLLFFSVGMTLLVFSPFLVKNNFGQYPLIQSFIAVNYYRYPINFPLIVSIICLFLVFTPFLLKWGSKRKFLVSGKSAFLQLFVFLLFSGWIMWKSVNFGKEEIMEYDFYVRMRKWENIVKKAEKDYPTSPLSVTCLNLALAKQGQLGERMFEFFQNGVDGLIPSFVKDYTIPMISGEVYYHLGFVNTAQRYSFEAMEALPDYQKSVRTIKRLAETSLINGNFALSRKYLKILQKTLYYKKWAVYFEKAMESKKVIDQHPEYGVLRKYKLDEDFLFSEGEKDMMLGILFSKNDHNRMAFEYLMAYCLLEKDVQHFVQYFPMGQSLMYFSIPRHFQEALYYAWDVSKSDVLKDIPYDINSGIKNSLNNYKRVYSSRPNPHSLLKQDYSDTYWYYFHFRNKN